MIFSPKHLSLAFASTYEFQRLLLGQTPRVLLAELTGKNANVFYELGLGHAIGKPIVLISETMDDVPFDLQALRVILYNKNDPKWGDKLRNDIVSALEATLSEPIKAVPTMFRKKVKSQAPAESESSSKFASLDRRIASLEQKSIVVIEDKTERLIGPTEASRIIEDYFRHGFSKREIIRRLNRRGVPESFVRDNLNKLGPSLF